MYSDDMEVRPPHPPSSRNHHQQQQNSSKSSSNNNNKPTRRFNNNNRKYREAIHSSINRQQDISPAQRGNNNNHLSSNSNSDSNLQTQSSETYPSDNQNRRHHRNSNNNSQLRDQQRQVSQMIPTTAAQSSTVSSSHHQQQHQVQPQKKIVIILKTKPKEKRRFVVPVDITWEQFLRGVSERLRIVHVKAIYDQHNIEICTPEDIFDGETLYVIPYTKKEDDTRKISREHLQGKNIGITTYFNNLDQETTLPGGKKLIKPPTPIHKSPKHLNKVKKREDEQIRKAKQRIAVGLNTYFAAKEEEGDLKQGRQYIPAPPPKPAKPTGVNFPIKTGSYERWKELNPRNLPDNTKPRGPKIVENCGVWRLSGREPKSRLPAGYDPEHKLGKKHYWSNKHRFNDGRHAVQTLVGQMLDWTKSKHKLWHKDLHKKHLMDTQFFEKKKFTDENDNKKEEQKEQYKEYRLRHNNNNNRDNYKKQRQEYQHNRNNNRSNKNNYIITNSEEDYPAYKRNYRYLGKQPGGQNIIRVRSKHNNSNNDYYNNSKSNGVARRPEYPSNSSRNRIVNRSGGKKHYLRRKRLGGVVQV